MSISLKERIRNQDAKIDIIYNHLKDEEFKRVKKKGFKLPGKIRGKSRKAIRDGKLLAVYLRNNKNMEFRIVKVIGGVIQIDDYEFAAYESDAVYMYKKGKLMLPVVVIFEWRLTTVGGSTDTLIQRKAKLMGGSDDIKDSELLGLKSYAQQTIIRAIEVAKVESGIKKKKGLGAIWWIIGGAVVIYIIGKALGLV